jgi:hypothetical protein
MAKKAAPKPQQQDEHAVQPPRQDKPPEQKAAAKAPVPEVRPKKRKPGRARRITLELSISAKSLRQIAKCFGYGSGAGGLEVTITNPPHDPSGQHPLGSSISVTATISGSTSSVSCWLSGNGMQIAGTPGAGPPNATFSFSSVPSGQYLLIVRTVQGTSSAAMDQIAIKA